MAGNRSRRIPLVAGMARGVALGIVMASVVGASPAAADAPPHPREYGRFSANGRYLAVVSLAPELTVYEVPHEQAVKANQLGRYARDRRYHTAMLFADRLLDRLRQQVAGRSLWHAPFATNGYDAHLHVGDDGMSVIAVFAAPTERGALFFYREGRLVQAYQAADIPFDRHALATSRSDFWLMDGAGLTLPRPHWAKVPEIVWEIEHSLDFEGFADEGRRFFVTTVDGRQHVFDVATGNRLDSREWLFVNGPFQPSALPAEPRETMTDEERVAFLLEALEDIDTNVRQDAAGGFWHLSEAKRVSPEAGVRGVMRRRGVAPALIRALRDPDAGVRMNAAQALGHLGDKQAVAALSEAAEDPNQTVREVATESLARLGAVHGSL